LLKATHLYVRWRTFTNAMEQPNAKAGIGG
jgi:hypothetical protein